MDLKDKITNRFNIIMAVIVVMIIALSLRLAVLTIAQGEYYRDLSDNKIIKNVYKAPIRGEIKDRNGKLLAGNKPSFTVQMLKDQVNKLETEEKNKVFLDLIRFLEEDGAPYIDDFPIVLNQLKYIDEADYDRELYSPIDKIVDIIAEKELLGEVLELTYVDESYPEHYDFIVINRAINALKDKGIDMPVETDILDDKLNIEFNEEKDIETFKKENNLSAGDTPMTSVLKLIADDKAVVKKVVDHSISRKLVYDLLHAKGLIENIELDDFSISFEEEYVDHKRKMMNSFSEITKDSSAEDDFINMFYNTSIKNFLQSSVKKETKGKKEEFIFPGEILFDSLEKAKINIPVEIKTSNDGTVEYQYTDKKNSSEVPAIDFLIERIGRTETFKEFMLADQIRPLAQKQLLSDGVNPKISVSEGYEYVSINNLKEFYSGNKIKEGSSVEEAFKQLRKKYKIDEKLSTYEVRAIFVMYNQLIKQGYLAYQPIYIAYGIKESTVAKIEESMVNTEGININIEPVRYYPQGKLAAHMLGYLGKISQPNEIKEYIDEKKYSPSSLIGKTGIEQSFEANLKGQGGIKKLEVDSSGNSTHTLEEEKSIPGDNLYLTLDMDVQRVAEESLEKTLKELQRGGTYTSKWGDFKFGTNKGKGRPYVNATSGATVAIDIKTGKVIASASFPSYDPNLFSTGINSTDWESLFPEDEKDTLAPRPLYNIATQTAVSPGSTFKMITGLAGLEKGLSADYAIRDMGFVEIGDRPFNCLLWTTSRRTHGYENIYDALRDSCNYYFYTLAMGQNQKTGEGIPIKLEIEDIIDMSNKFGLSEKTGIEINIPSESSGTVPNPDRKIANTKAILKRILDSQIEKTFKKDFEYTPEDKEEAIDEIISWLEYDVPLTYTQVMKKLIDLNIDPDAKITHGAKSTSEDIASAITFTYVNFAGWNITDTLRVTIGQGQNGYTPIQVANYVATLANGGYKHKLTLIDSIKNYSNTETVYEYKEESERIELKDYGNLEDIKKGMLKVTKEGAYRSVFEKLPVDVGGKTGTAENDSINPSTQEKYDDFSWFVGFAPYDDPQIAVATVIFQGGSGGYSAPMTRDIIAEYLGLNKGEEEEMTPYENSLKR
nr:penicillin-binding transpeptidase domain-containing protein [Tissierella sp.]